jgi:TRAP-type C4-dicarboxylate transport system substrate-binding protein
VAIPIRLAGYQGERSVHSRALRELAGALGTKSFDVAVTEDITRDGRRAADLLTLTEAGELEICYFSASYLSHLVPELRLLDLPFLFADRRSAHAALDGEFGAMVREKLEATSAYRALGWWDNGFRHLTSSKRPIRTPTDCLGQRLRTMGDAPQHGLLFAAMGFEPVPLDVRDLMPAIECGRVDAQENPLTNIFNFGIHRHHRWITLTGHLFGASLLLCNRRFFGALTAAERTTVEIAARAATTHQRKLAAREDELVFQWLDATDAELIELTPDELEGFRETAAPLRKATLSAFPEAARLVCC